MYMHSVPENDSQKPRDVDVAGHGMSAEQLVGSVGTKVSSILVATHAGGGSVAQERKALLREAGCANASAVVYV